MSGRRFIFIGSRSQLLALASQNHRFARNFLTKRYNLFVSLARESKIAPAVSWLIVSRVGTLANLFDGSTVPIKEGGRYAARIRAIHPVTARPVPGVSVQASLDLDTDDNNPLNADGAFRVNHFSNVSVSTDKPLYQPGQGLHARLMAFDINKKAIASESVILKILDPEETLVYRTELQTSRFGIAAADWQIPDNLRLGTYRIQANFGEGPVARDQCKQSEHNVALMQTQFSWIKLAGCLQL
jgi:hypothetical protein